MGLSDVRSEEEEELEEREKSGSDKESDYETLMKISKKNHRNLVYNSTHAA